MTVLRALSTVETPLPGMPEHRGAEVVRWWRPLAAAVVLAVGTVVLVASSGLLPAPTSRLVSDLTTLAGAVSACAGFALTAWRGPAEQRRWRLLIAVAMAVWLCGQALWTWHRSFDARAMPFPEMANAFFLALPACSFAALLRLSRRDRRTAVTAAPRRAVVLDALIIVASAVALTWETVLDPLTGRPHPVTQLLADIYTILDLGLITVVALLAATLRSMWRLPIALIMAALVAIGFSDAMYMYAVSNGGVASAYADIGYMSGPALLLLAAVAPDRRFSRNKPPLAMWGLPYAPLLAVCGFVVGTTAAHEQAHPVEVYFLCGIVGLVALRQLLTQRQVHMAHRQLAHQATHDPLTGMANRSLLLDELARALRRARGGPARPGVFFLDVDRFKELNDTLGHTAGDVVLRTIAARLRTTVRDSDTIARLGGDEFVVLVDPAPQRPRHLANRLAATIREPVALQGRSELYHPSASIGYVRVASHDTPDHALARADQAMYRAKRTRTHTYTEMDS